MPEVLSPYETALVERMRTEWDPDRLMPISEQFVKVEPLSDRAKELLTDLATGYGMTIRFGFEFGSNYVNVRRPRRQKAAP